MILSRKNLPKFYCNSPIRSLFSYKPDHFFWQKFFNIEEKQINDSKKKIKEKKLN